MKLPAAEFPPIAEYGFLSDCQTAALVGPDGTIEWMCLPRMDAPSVFGAVLGREAGHYRLGPADQRIPTARRYIPGTLAIETTWRTPTGWLVLLDALLVAEEDGGARNVLLRIARCVSGTVTLELDCCPVFDYGRAPARWGTGAYGVAAFARAEGVASRIRVASDLHVEPDHGHLRAGTQLSRGRARYVALAWGEQAPPRAMWEAEEQLSQTCRYWQRWLDGGRFPDHPWTDHLQRSALTLKGLTYAPTGAMIAAPTTSLPETPGGIRNWDYRYTWIRDSALMLLALYTLGLDQEAESFFTYLTRIADRDGDEMQIMYSIDGERDLTEVELEHLSGYQGARPVRIGNGAAGQTQNDVWGELIATVYVHMREHDAIDVRRWEGIVRVVERAVAVWREPDQGIWEARGAPRHYTASKISCWAAADRGARLAARRGDTDRAEQWAAVAEEIRADVLEHGTDPRGVLVQHYETTTLDASLLPAVLLAFLPAEDPRLRATVLAIAEELTEDGLVLRYRTDETDDGLVGEEGTFTICSFWLVSALVRIGEPVRARALCERLLAHAGPLGLFAEQIDARTGRHLGNFPQGFTHLALIDAVLSLIRAEDLNKGARG
jgi:GH15 family glucan-1,4-alpha-glucosidase